MDYCKSFVFVDGERHSGGWSWRLGCCGLYLLDDELEWFAEEEYGQELTPVWLADKKGNELLRWFDRIPEQESDDT